MEVVVLSGVSGSGKTAALHALEDADYFCVDNLPSPLLETFIRLAEEHPSLDRVAVVMDVREAALYRDLARRLDDAGDAGHALHVVFLDADDDKLILRYKETRRRHPLISHGTAETVTEAIALEREWLRPIRARSSTVIDTTGLTVHELKRHVGSLFTNQRTRTPMTLALMSFGFRHGLPPEADYVFDVRFLPNPYFIDGLREGRGVDAPVADFVMSQPAAKMMLDHVDHLLRDVLPLAEEEGKTSMTVAIGCTGGHHRSVAMIEALADRLADSGQETIVRHRDIAR